MSERTLYSCQLRFPIYIGIYVRVVRVSCVPFFPYTKEAPLKIILKIYGILEISGNFNVCGSLRFLLLVRACALSTRMCTIKIKMAEGFLETKVFRNAHTDTRAQL